MHLDVHLTQHTFDLFAQGRTHARQDLLAHLKDKHARLALQRVAEIKPYKVDGPVEIQIEYTTRNSLPLDTESRTGAEVLDDRTIRFRGKDVLEAWRLYRSR